VVFTISAGFLVGALALLATALFFSQRYLDESQRLSAAGDAQGAMKASQLAARLDPFDTEALEAQSFILEQQAHYEDAASSLSEAIERDPHNYTLYVMLGNLQLNELDDLDAAEKSYRKVLELNPKSTDVREALAQTLIEEGELGEARDEYEKLREEKKISYQGLYDLGRIYVRTGRPEEGLRDIKRAKQRAEAELNKLKEPLRFQQQKLIESMQLAIANALVVQGRYAQAREILAQSASPQAPALLQLLNSDPDAYRESVVTSAIY